MISNEFPQTNQMCVCVCVWCVCVCVCVRDVQTEKLCTLGLRQILHTLKTVGQVMKCVKYTFSFFFDTQLTQ